MRKTLLLFAFILTTLASFGQERESTVFPKYDQRSDSIFKNQMKYFWKSQIGEWEEKNGLYDTIYMKSFKYKDSRYYVLFEKRQISKYKYPSIREGAYSIDALSYFVMKEKDFNSLCKKINEKNAKPIEVTSTVCGELESDKNGSTHPVFGKYDMSEEFAMKKIKYGIDCIESKKTDVSNWDYLLTLTSQNNNIVRFIDDPITTIKSKKKEDSKIYQQYYECSYDDFLKILSLKNIE